MDYIYVIVFLILAIVICAIAIWINKKNRD